MTTLNRAEHPVGTRVLITCPQYALLTEATVLEWTQAGHVKVCWNLSGYQGWIHADRIDKHPIVEVLTAKSRD